MSRNRTKSQANFTFQERTFLFRDIYFLAIQITFFSHFRDPSKVLKVRIPNWPNSHKIFQKANLLQICPWSIFNKTLILSFKVSRSSTENSRPKACYFPNFFFHKANLIQIHPWSMLQHNLNIIFKVSRSPLKIAGRRPAIFQ